MAGKFLKRVLSLALTVAVGAGTICAMPVVSADGGSTSTEVWQTIFEDNFDGTRSTTHGVQKAWPADSDPTEVEASSTIIPTGWTKAIVTSNDQGFVGYAAGDGENNTALKLNGGAYNAALLQKKFDTAYTTGKYKISFKMKADGVDGTQNRRAFLDVGESDNPNGRGVSTRLAGWANNTTESVVSVSTDFGEVKVNKTADELKTWMNISIEIDFDNNTMKYYINGAEAASKTDASALANLGGIKALTFFCPAASDWYSQWMYIDDVKFEKATTPKSVSGIKFVKGTEKYSRYTAPIGATGAEITFSDDVSAVADGKVTLKKGTTPVTVNGTYTSSTKKYAMTFDALEAGETYTLTVDKSVLATSADFTETFTVGTEVYQTLWSSDFSEGSSTTLSKDTDGNDFAGSYQPVGWTKSFVTGGSSKHTYENTDGDYELKITEGAWNRTALIKAFDTPYTTGKYRLTYKIRYDNANASDMILSLNTTQDNANFPSPAKRLININRDGSTITAQGAIDVGNPQISSTTMVTNDQLKQGVIYTAEFDLDNDKASYLVNGEYITDGTNTTHDRNFNEDISGFRFFGNNGTGNQKIYYLDDVKFEKVMPQSSVTDVKFKRGSVVGGANAVPQGATTAEITFSDDVVSVDASKVTLKQGTTPVTFNGTYDAANKKYTMTFDALKPETSYTLSVDKVVTNSTTGYEKTFTTGTRAWDTVFFSDFEEGASTQHGILTNGSAAQTILPVGFTRAVATYDNSKLEYVDATGGGKELKVTYGAWNGVSLSKEFDQPVTSGKYRFSAKIRIADSNAGDFWVDVNTGIMDRLWPNTDEGGVSKRLLGVNGNGTISGSVDFGMVTTTKTTTEVASGVVVTAELDLDNNTAKYYVDGTQFGEEKDISSYRGEGGSLASITGFRLFTSNAGEGSKVFYIDDVKIEKATTPVSVTNVKVVKGETEYAVSNAPAGADKIKITFSDNVSAYLTDKVQLIPSGGDSETLIGTYDNATNTFTATLATALAEDTTYMLQIDKSVLLTSTNYQTTFTTTGGIVYDADPVFASQAGNKVKATFALTRNSGTGTASVILVSYDGNKIKDIKKNDAAFGADGKKTGELTVDITDENTVVKLFVWDNLTNCKPILGAKEMD